MTFSGLGELNAVILDDEFQAQAQEGNGVVCPIPVPTLYQLPLPGSAAAGAAASPPPLPTVPSWGSGRQLAAPFPPGALRTDVAMGSGGCCGGPGEHELLPHRIPPSPIVMSAAATTTICDSPSPRLPLVTVPTTMAFGAPVGLAAPRPHGGFNNGLDEAEFRDGGSSHGTRGAPSPTPQQGRPGAEEVEADGAEAGVPPSRATGWRKSTRVRRRPQPMHAAAELSDEFDDDDEPDEDDSADAGGCHRLTHGGDDGDYYDGGEDTLGGKGSGQAGPRRRTSKRRRVARGDQDADFQPDEDEDPSPSPSRGRRRRAGSRGSERLGSSGGGEDELVLEAMAPEEEDALRVLLRRKTEDLEECVKHLGHMNPAQRKKYRNKKASCVSRLRRKLAVCDLQKRYDALRAEMAQLREAHKGALKRLAAYEAAEPPKPP